jgi:hypothetical protein
MKDLKKRKRETGSREIEARARREFAKTLVALAATPIVTSSLIPGEARAQTPQPADAVSSASDAMTQVVRARYGKYLKEDQVAEIRRSVERAIRNGDRLKQVKLENGDEPAFAFSADFE